MCGKAKRMNSCEAIRKMMEVSSTTAAALSRKMGKSDTYVSTTLSKGSSPRAENLAAMAKIMGFELILRQGNHEIVIASEP